MENKAKKYIGTAEALVKYATSGTVLEIGDRAPCTQHQIDKGYFDAKTLKKGEVRSVAEELAKHRREVKEQDQRAKALAEKALGKIQNKAMGSPETKGKKR